MKGSFRGNRVFSDDNSVRGNKFDRLKKVGKEADGQRNSSAKRYHPDPPLMAAESSLLEPSSFSFFRSRYSSGMKNFHSYPQAAENSCPSALMGSLIREEGHIYSLATSGELLYTGSDSKNIRVWRNKKEYSGFRSNSGLVKSIVIANDKIFTGHQDGKIRVWKMPSVNESIHKKIGTLPTVHDYFRRSMKPSNYVEARRHRNVLWIEHFDAISALCLNEDQTFLYSASWDKTFKVWRVSDFKCLESVKAHDDAINTLVSTFDGLVFTGSADGTLKVWRREMQGKGTKHFFSQTLLKQECAVTAMAVNGEASFIYCGSSDGLVNFWEREKSLSHCGALRGHKLAVLCLATAGNLVLSGSTDLGISVWRREAEAEHTFLWTLTGHTGPVKCLAVEQNREAGATEGRWIVYSGSLDKTVKMWMVPEEAPAPSPAPASAPAPAPAQNDKSHRNEGCSSAATRTLDTALSFSRMVSTS